jgi:hypothetical protein
LLTRKFAWNDLKGAWRRLRLLLDRPLVLPSVGLSLLSMPASQTQPGSPATLPPPPAALEPALRRRMRGELSQLLDRVPSARWVVPALRVVESALASRRTEAVDRLPVVVMQEAARQLHLLGRTHEGDVLRTLRDRLCLLIGEPAPEDDDDGAFEPGRTVEVRDISLTQFMAIDDATCEDAAVR